MSSNDSDSNRGKTKLQKGKVWILFGIMFVYILIAGAFITGVELGLITKSLPIIRDEERSDNTTDAPKQSIIDNLQAAQSFVDKNLRKENGHIDLYIQANNTKKLIDNNTNSEAISYYLLWKAREGDKESFDRELKFVKQYMLEPQHGYLMWRLTPEGKAEGDGSNIATDADLRAIKALLIAEEKWGDPEYTELIDKLAKGLERLGITRDGYLAPYGGVSGATSVWVADEVWLSYSDFRVFRELSERRGAPWNTMYEKMKQATLEAQLENGQYNSMLTKKREYGNGIDGGGYSINSMWIMVRSAESKDPQLMESARKSLQFYKNKYQIDNELYAQYDSSGNP
ncbi:MAG TPA: glycosyl hydrolase family 8, partial [Alphaproteobacteria bacterium]|nr:glycosyl hydrolase family 8 [Alphaproteobacteria bacterium]